MIAPRSILSRYLARDILLTTAAVTFVLLLIFLSGRFAKYLVDVTTGKISAEIVFSLLWYRAPNMLERILPLGLFISILLVFGRLFVDNEISVLQAAGISLPQLLLASSAGVVPVTLLVALLTLYVSPQGLQHSENMLNEEQRRSEIDLVGPGKFLQLRGGGGVVYTGEIGEGRRSMKDVFIARQQGENDWLVVRSASGFQHYDEARQQRYLTLENGVRYQLLPGRPQTERLRFASLQQHVQPTVEYDPRKLDQDGLPTTALFSKDKRSYKATFQWRVSLILLVPIVSMIGVAISRTTPRRGRYVKLVPALLLYFAYMALLDALRNSMGDGDWPVMPGLFAVHAVFIAIGVLFLHSDKLRLQWQRRTA